MSIDGLCGSVDSPVARSDTALVIACMVVSVLAVVLTPVRALWAFSVFAAMAISFVGLARLPVAVLGRRSLVEIPFLLFAVALPFVGAGERREVLGVPLSVEGTWSAWGIVAKATIGVTCSIALAWSVPPARLLDGLARLRCPRTLVAIAGFMVRYLDVVAGELRRLRIARVSRGDDPGWLWQGRAVAATAGTVFVRTFERGERVQRSMLARGFDGTFPATVAPGPRRSSAWPVLAAVSFPVAAMAVAAVANLVAP